MAAGGQVPGSAVDIQTCPAAQSRRGHGLLPGLRRDRQAGKRSLMRRSKRQLGMARIVGGCHRYPPVRACTRTRVVQDRIPPTAAEVTAMDPKGEQTPFVCTTYIQETRSAATRPNAPLAGRSRRAGALGHASPRPERHSHLQGTATLRQPTQESAGWSSERASRHRPGSSPTRASSRSSSTCQLNAWRSRGPRTPERYSTRSTSMTTSSPVLPRAGWGPQPSVQGLRRSLVFNGDQQSREQFRLNRKVLVVPVKP
jgi:hypothetical protein